MKKIFIVLTLLLGINLYAQKDMLIISTSMGAAPQNSKVQALISIAKEHSLDIDFTFDTKINKNDYLSTINKYKIVMFDSLAGARSINSLMEKFGPAIQKSKKELIVIPISIKDENPYRKNISIQKNIDLNEYWYNGGEKNFQNFSKFINSKILHRTKQSVSKAIIIPESGIYHPKNPNIVFKDLKEYAQFFNIDLKNLNQPLIAIGMHRGSIVSGALKHINTMIRYIENKGIKTLPFFTEVGAKDFVGSEFLTYNNKTIVDVIVNFQIMIIDHEKLKDDYKKLNVPILHALYYSQGELKDWQEDKSGVNFTMIPMSYIIPETIGYTDSMIVATQNKKTKQMDPILPQLHSLANKAINLSTLRQKENKDKKIAVMFYNYPTGINNMGASFMNSPETLELILKNMKNKGYDTVLKDSKWFETEATKSLKAYYEKGHDQQMLKDDVATLLPFETYLKYFRALPLKTQKLINKAWKSPRFSRMVVRKDGRKYFLIPRIKLGNIVVMPQPRRSERVDLMKEKLKKLKHEDKKLWHNQKIPVNHSYLASYFYVKEQFKANALVHLGTHGTQEWMPGKERGLSIYDSALLPLGDMPVVYPYITNNVAEAMQVKRRGRGTLISHQTPPFSISGTYKELSEIMELINQYKSVDTGMLKDKVQQQITNICIKMNIHKDVEVGQENIAKDFDDFISKVEDYILGTSSSAQPLGMHTFGTIPKEEYLIMTVMQMVGKEFMEKADGKDYFSKNYTQITKSNAYNLVKKFAIDHTDFKELENKDFKPYLLKATEYVNDFKNNKETKNLLRALNAEYIETGVGGDPIRNPISVPTGNNMYGFDPTKVPTKAAYKTGTKLMKDFVANYYKENKKYPTKLTFNLWSLETMRHYGVLESQILYAMGVKPIWNETGVSNDFIQNIVKQKLQNYLPQSMASYIAKLITVSRIEFVLSLTPNDWLIKPKKMLKHANATNKGQIIDVEIIPYKELKRPRIDTIISVTGLYRDTFPQTMKLLAKAVEKVAQLKEETNNVYLNTVKIQKQLMSKNLSKEEAIKLSTIRVFSNKSGSYGSGIAEIDDTGKWDDEKRLTKNYFETRGYYFGTDESTWNKKIPGLDLYAKNLSGTQSVIFSRTSNLYGLLTSDDPYGYFGSISMAIRKLDGKSPKSYISNLRDPNGAKIQSTAKFLSQELRSRYFHPKWIEAMKEEGYSGTTGVLDVVKNFWGWQVVDPTVVRDDQWDEFVEVYIDDKYNMDLKKWFTQNNPDSLAQITEKMLEANRKGYWKTSQENIKKLTKLYKELEKEFKVKSYNLEFNKFVKTKAIGFGLLSPTGQVIQQKQVPKTKQTKQIKKSKPEVKGQKLEKVKQKVVKKDYTNEIIMLLLALVISFGFVYGLKKED